MISRSASCARIASPGWAWACTFQNIFRDSAGRSVLEERPGWQHIDLHGNRAATWLNLAAIPLGGALEHVGCRGITGLCVVAEKALLVVRRWILMGSSDAWKLPGLASPAAPLDQLAAGNENPGN